MLKSAEKFSGSAVIWQWVPDRRSFTADRFADIASAIRGTVSNSLFGDRGVHAVR